MTFLDYEKAQLGIIHPLYNVSTGEGRYQDCYATVNSHGEL